MSLRRLACLACGLLLSGCAAMPISLTIGYKEMSVGATWQPPPSGKNPINSGK